MENFRKKVKLRIAYLSLCVVAVSIALGVGVLSQNGVLRPGAVEGHLNNFAHGVNAGILASMILVPVIRIIQMVHYLRDEKKLRLEYIKYTDERTREIEEKSSNLSCFISIMILLLGVLVFGFFNEIVAVTLLVALGVLLLSKVLAKAIFIQLLSRRFV